MKVDFYHLTQRPLEQVLPQIAEKVLAAGQRLLVIAGEERERARLDQLLWTYSADSFLPHGLSGGEDDARQPILIGGDASAANGAGNVALADGVWRDEALAFERTFHFFGEERIAEARAAWKRLGDRPEVERRYWKQNAGGKWEQAA